MPQTRQVLPEGFDKRAFSYTRNAGNANPHRISRVWQDAFYDVLGGFKMFRCGTFDHRNGAAEQHSVALQDAID